MAKKSTTTKKNKKKATTKNRILPSEPAAEVASTPGGGMHAVRETIESIVIAFVLAFLFRTFEAEAFVIPTGSMSPALQGRHKDVCCSECGYRFRATASDEKSDGRLFEISRLKQVHRSVRDLTAALRARRSPAEQQDIQSNLYYRQKEEEDLTADVAAYDTVAGVCPMCRQMMALRSDVPPGVPPYVQSEEAEDETSYPGDRILVNKYAYHHRQPERWDVVVFKFPGNGEMNYIKRLVGLPNETLRIYQGDIFVRNASPKGTFQIERKPADKVYAMLQSVHDTDFEPSSLYDAGWPLRWAPTTPDGWQVEEKRGEQNVEQQFQIKQAEGDETPLAWLRYRHLVPQHEDWSRVHQFEATGEYSGVSKEQWLREAKPELIRDFNPYNAVRHRGGARPHAGARSIRGIRDIGWDLPEERYGRHWVGDLAVECDLEVETARGELHLDLVEAGKHFTCKFDLETGQATLGVEGLEESSVKVDTPVNSAGTYRLLFANVDDQLLLWVENKLMPVSETHQGLIYDADKVFGERKNAIPTTSNADLADLAPVGIGARGASLRVNRLEVLRDIYYIATNSPSQFCDYPNPQLATTTPVEKDRIPPLQSFRQLFTEPSAWPRFLRRRHVDFDTAEEQLFVMGDNSPASQDCRLWISGKPNERPGGPYLDRRLLIGKAVCVFWPHSWGRVPGASVLPGFPNFGDMRIVR